MKKIVMMVAALALVTTACAEGDTSPEETTTTVAVLETTTTADATTTTAEATTTTEILVEVQDAGAFLASLDAVEPPTSGRVEGTIVMRDFETEEQIIDEATISFSSGFNESGDGWFLMDMSSLAAMMPSDPDDPFAEFAASMLTAMEVRQIGDRSYVKFGFINLFLGAETEWVSMPAEEGDSFSDGFETVPSDPSEVLDFYDGAYGTVEEVGIESVNGVDATHYRIELDLAALADEMTEEELAELQASGVFADGVLPIDLWVDARGYTVRMVFEIDGSTVESPEGESFGSMLMTWDVFDINGTVIVEPPPAADVTAVEDLEGWGDFGSFDFGADL